MSKVFAAVKAFFAYIAPDPFHGTVEVDVWFEKVYA